ncbi:two-component system phosphate regulon sensor histidine kinase PhoR [Altererythrobacter atlanticus]|uniref:histidine kinase n=1 Tax=Croceibacterium atlanticum TaxID=1267766 RepID=A0A0F7KQL1_9SPHN|nr:ATP-binding protein [Croceibacterium atlanticum]AKH41447.1 Alkaline phosphatase synthesis sensor protein PhoR [Croceibacterium atlanticum]MBB5732909.1 two-component system phosphate regulon sensor histidine kinase PhoR [Croceibacterium atlanticum]
MEQGRKFPISGVVLALATGIVMLLYGVDIWLVLGVMLVWCASYWLTASPPEPPQRESTEGVKLTRTGMRDLIEHSGLPMLMLDGDRIIVANAAAREAIGAHVVGQDARVALRHPAAVDLLNRSGGGSATIQGLTGPRSNWQMSRQPLDARYSLIELINRTAEADVSRAHTDFVANASHELRTPLASIIGYMETLVDEGGDIDPKLAGRFHGTVLREARRLQSLVDDLMSLSRVEAEKHDQPRERVDLAPIVGQAARDGAGPDRLDRLDLHLPEDPVMVRGDYRQIEQLVRNLVDNGLKYGDQALPVTVRLTSDQRRRAIISVEDRGEGIAPEHIPHLTRRFYRTDPGRSRAAGGTGLGLAIVKHIVERHRGTLDISSKVGRGTTVTIRLPLAEEEAQAD